MSEHPGRSLQNPFKTFNYSQQRDIQQCNHLIKFWHFQTLFGSENIKGVMMFGHHGRSLHTLLKHFFLQKCTVKLFPFLRIYCIDPQALVFMFNEGSSYGPLFSQFSPWFAWYTFIIRASDVVLWIFYIFSGLIYFWGTRWPPPLFQGPLVAQHLPKISHSGRPRH